ncbi:MAG: hypothetical protein V4450_08180 [Bacteroidota bacterium]
MAHITEEGMSGAIGNLVFYTMNGKKYARSKPNFSKRSRKAMSEGPLATVFGIVSTFGTAILRGLQPSLLFPFSLATYNQARGWMRKQYAPNHGEELWELSARHNDMCQVNTAANLQTALQSGIAVSDAGKGKIKVGIDEISPLKHIKAPAGTRGVNIKLVALSRSPDDRKAMVESCMEQYTILYSDVHLPAKETVLSIKGKPGDIVVVVVALEFEMERGAFDGYSREAKYLPAAIVAMGKLKG